MTQHFIEKCQYCNAIVVQCRCPAIDKTVRWGICYSCKKVKEQAEKDASESIYNNPYIGGHDALLYTSIYKQAETKRCKKWGTDQ